MAINSISTFNSLQNFLQNISQTQNSLNDSQVQISSGYVSQTFDGLDGNVEQFISLNAQVDRLQNYQQGNGIVTSRLQTTNTAVNQSIQIANSLKSLMVSQLSGTSNSAAFKQQLEANRDSLVSQLNATFQGKYIFGGSKTNTPPVITPVPSPVETGTPDASYYQGSTQNTTYRIADGQELENSIRADDPAFQKIFAAIDLALNSGNSSDKLTQAEDLLDSGLEGIIGMQASVNATVVRVNQTNTQNQSVQTYYQSLTQTMSKSDVVALSAKVAQDQSILQASFAVFARISALTLSNFLK